jgi:hypothetical protein
MAIQQIKSGTRTIQTYVKRGHLQKYLDEYFFRLNRSIYKKTIFNKLFERMVNHKLVLEKELVLIKWVNRYFLIYFILIKFSYKIGIT